MQYRQFRLPGLVLFLVSMSAACGSDGAAGEQPASGKMVFSHIGIYTAEKKPGGHSVAGRRVWVTDFRKHRCRVEWLWFEPLRPVTGQLPHVAYRVENIEAAAKGMKVLSEPFCPGVFGVARVGFYQTDDGAVVEFMEFKDEHKCDSDGVAGEQPASGKMVFSHIGIITTEKKPGELFVPASRVWVTDFRKHPCRVEWLRFEPDSQVTGPLRNLPHVAYEVENIETAAKGMKVLMEPFCPGIFDVARAGFYQTDDGAVVELMEFKDEDE